MSTGEQVFARLEPEERVALKRFMTGQIQNVLANEYGIGGTKTLRSQVEAAIKREAEQVVRNLIERDFAERIADRVLRGHFGKVGVTREILSKALNDAAKVEMTKVVQAATDRINIHIGVAPLPGEPGDGDPNFGTF